MPPHPHCLIEAHSVSFFSSRLLTFIALQKHTQSQPFLHSTWPYSLSVSHLTQSHGPRPPSLTLTAGQNSLHHRPKQAFTTGPRSLFSTSLQFFFLKYFINFFFLLFSLLKKTQNYGFNLPLFHWQPCVRGWYLNYYSILLPFLKNKNKIKFYQALMNFNDCSMD